MNAAQRCGVELPQELNISLLCYSIWVDDIMVMERNHTERTPHSGAEYNSLSNLKIFLRYYQYWLEDIYTLTMLNMGLLMYTPVVINMVSLP